MFSGWKFGHQLLNDNFATLSCIITFTKMQIVRLAIKHAEYHVLNWVTISTPPELQDHCKLTNICTHLVISLSCNKHY